MELTELGDATAYYYPFSRKRHCLEFVIKMIKTELLFLFLLLLLIFGSAELFVFIT